MEYYGNNDWRDYLAHYGVKGMKWRNHKYLNKIGDLYNYGSTSGTTEDGHNKYNLKALSLKNLNAYKYSRSSKNNVSGTKKIGFGIGGRGAYITTKKRGNVTRRTLTLFKDGGYTSGDVLTTRSIKYSKQHKEALKQEKQKQKAAEKAKKNAQKIAIKETKKTQKAAAKARNKSSKLSKAKKRVSKVLKKLGI